MCAVCECGIGHTTTFHFRVLPLQYVRRQHSTKNVCAAQAQSRGLNYCGLKTNAEFLSNNCCDFNLTARVQEEKCVLCGEEAA